MFTGIIKEVGLVKSFGRAGDVHKLVVGCGAHFQRSDIGDSIAVDGVCLTLSGKDVGLLSFDVMAETIKRSTMVSLRAGDRVNLESAVRAEGAFGGHFVTGHADCTGTVEDVRKRGEYVISVRFPENFSDLVIEKGSVAVDGVSLTVGAVSRGAFSVYIIPHTLKATTLGSKKPGDAVNIEFDILGKYCVRFLGREGRRPGITEGFLRESGF